ncbi:MAG: peptidase MA family metallohydrolase [Acidobacteriota bacterium]|nr:peptidase MA family metallohydrolase [Acidobacteriota bacterium]
MLRPSSTNRFWTAARVLGMVLLGLLGVAAATPADTIVLKNGRRILAFNVAEVGEKIRYETSAGELSLPKSIVDHIEKGGAMPMAGSGVANASNLAITPPAMEAAASNGGEIEHAVVHDGAIDRQYIAKLEGETQGGSSAAGIHAAVGHHAAAMFELSRGDMDHALADERTALTYAPDEPLLLMNVAYLHLRRSEYKQSLDYLEHAHRVAPNNPDVAKLAGWAYYGLNKIEPAVAEWKHSLLLRPDAEVQAALDKAQRDRQEEESYKENESPHFTLRYSGAAEPALARDILRTLEVHYAAIESELNFTPPDSIGVVLYTQQAFSDITRAPGWVGALNDGRLRLPVQGLTGVNQELARVLKHELTHSFVQQKTHGRAPTWMQEGLAQWMEGKRSGDNSAVLMQIYGDGHAVSLRSLEVSWMNFPADAAAYAYAWALANIEYIVQADGMTDVERILDRIGSGTSTETALHEVLHSDYSDLTRSTAEFLRKTYGR